MLVFVGAKMLLADIYKVPITLSLGVIALVLIASVVLSLVFPKKASAHDPVIHDPRIPRDDPTVAPMPPKSGDGSQDSR